QLGDLDGFDHELLSGAVDGGRSLEHDRICLAEFGKDAFEVPWRISDFGKGPGVQRAATAGGHVVYLQPCAVSPRGGTRGREKPARGVDGLCDGGYRYGRLGAEFARSPVRVDHAPYPVSRCTAEWVRDVELVGQAPGRGIQPSGSCC